MPDTPYIRFTFRILKSTRKISDRYSMLILYIEQTYDWFGTREEGKSVLSLLNLLVVPISDSTN